MDKELLNLVDKAFACQLTKEIERANREKARAEQTELRLAIEIEKADVQLTLERRKTEKAKEQLKKLQDEIISLQLLANSDSSIEQIRQSLDAICQEFAPGNRPQ